MTHPILPGSASSGSSAELLLACSPAAYSALTPPAAAGAAAAAPARRRVPTPADQGPTCATCVAWAVTAAAAAAVAAALPGVGADSVELSAQDLYFCSPAQPRPTCTSGWRLDAAAAQLAARPLLAARCARLCDEPNALAAGGEFSTAYLQEVWEVQRHIRKHGSVVTRFDVYSDLRPFFHRPANRRAVYRPGPGAVPVQAHAVTLVGYDNAQGFWVAGSSWGTGFADGGFFKVAMDCCGLLDPGDTVGISWAPRRPPAPPPATAAAPGAGGCKRHVGHAGEYLSDVALDVFRVPLAALVEANRGVLADLSAPVEGVVLVLCPAGGGGGGGSGSRGGGGGGGGLEPRPLSLRPQEQRPAALTGGGGGGGPSSGPGGGNGNASGGGGGNASGGGGGGGGGGSGVGGAQVGPHFAGPRVGGLPLDYCRVWATGCGQEAADYWCVTRGYPNGASAFDGPVFVGSTAMLFDAGSCRPPYRCGRFSYITCVDPSNAAAAAAGKLLRFPFPRAGGAPLDGCRSYGADCGGPAADFFCAMRGLGRAAAWGEFLGVPPAQGATVMPMTGGTCDTKRAGCRTFTHVTCSAAGVA